MTDVRHGTGEVEDSPEGIQLDSVAATVSSVLSPVAASLRLVSPAVRADGEPGPPVEADDAASTEPVLRVPEAQTPLPEVDRALPLLGMFADVVGRRRARYKIGLLKTLQADGAGRWKIRRLQEVVHWLEPSSVTELVADLKLAGVVQLEPISGFYRLTPSARIVTALLDAMTVPEVNPRVLVKALNKAMAFTLATGAGEDAVLRQFRSAVAVLRGDWDDLKRLIDEYSDSALLEAAELVRLHVDDMRELLDDHAEFIATQREHARFLEVDQEALDLVARLGTLSAEVIAAISGRADEHMRSGLRVDRSDVREFLTDNDVDTIAALVAGLARPAPFVVALDTAAVFEALMESAARVRSLPPRMPAPVALRRELPDRQPDAAQQIRGELATLTEPTTIADFTVREDWGTSVGRHSAVLDAYSRFSDLPELVHEPGVEEPNRCEVWRVSKTTVEGGT
jgi:hypothetical protein